MDPTLNLVSQLGNYGIAGVLILAMAWFGQRLLALAANTVIPHLTAKWAEQAEKDRAAYRADAEADRKTFQAGFDLLAARLDAGQADAAARIDRIERALAGGRCQYAANSPAKP